MEGHFEYADEDINSVAAENAFYCLAKSIINNNYFAAPELYNLLETSPALLLDKLVSVIISDIDEVSYGSWRYTYGPENPYKNPSARRDGAKLLPFLKFFVNSRFYNIQEDRTLMPSDIIEYSSPNVKAVISNCLRDKTYQNCLQTGEDIFNKTYRECESTLLRY